MWQVIRLVTKYLIGKKNSLHDVSVSQISSDTLERHGKHGIAGKNINFD